MRAFVVCYVFLFDAEKSSFSISGVESINGGNRKQRNSRTESEIPSTPQIKRNELGVGVKYVSVIGAFPN